jgi:hypothetical protein
MIYSLESTINILQFCFWENPELERPILFGILRESFQISNRTLSDPQLNHLVGDIKTATLEDIEMWKSINGRMSKRIRYGPPVFDVIVELTPKKFNSCKIIRNVGHAVDQVLQGKKFKAEVRTCNPPSAVTFQSPRTL